MIQIFLVPVVNLKFIDDLPPETTTPVPTTPTTPARTTPRGQSPYQHALFTVQIINSLPVDWSPASNR